MLFQIDHILKRGFRVFLSIERETVFAQGAKTDQLTVPIDVHGSGKSSWVDWSIYDLQYHWTEPSTLQRRASILRSDIDFDKLQPWLHRGNRAVLFYDRVSKRFVGIAINNNSQVVKTVEGVNTLTVFRLLDEALEILI